MSFNFNVRWFRGKVIGLLLLCMTQVGCSPVQPEKTPSFARVAANITPWVAALAVVDIPDIRAPGNAPAWATHRLVTLTAGGVGALQGWPQGFAAWGFRLGITTGVMYYLVREIRQTPTKGAEIPLELLLVW